MHLIWCEWDIGQEGLVFETEEAALKWLLKNETLEECYEEGLKGEEAVKDLIKGGLITVKSVKIIGGFHV